MNLEHQKLTIILAVAFVTIIAFTSVTPRVHSDDEHAGKVKEATEQSVKAGKVFDAIMQTPDEAIPRELLEHAKATDHQAPGQ